MDKHGNSNVWSHDKEVDAFRFIIEVAAYVHSLKSETYRDSWKKRGWQISIFSNISRKFDRLDAIFSDAKKYLVLFENFDINNPSESVADTFIDLGNYCFLAMTEILFTKREMMFKFLSSLDIADSDIGLLTRIKKDQSVNLD